MELNRQNYLSWLMAALDGELSPEEQLRWEAFLAEHPDVQAEAEEWALTKLVPDENLPAFDKSSLYRQGEAIGRHNHEEWFSQYTDNELSPEQREAVELFVLQNPDTQASFLLHQATRLPQENLVFADKQSLYRQEERRRPVVLWMGRLAAAAVLTGLVFALYTLGPAPQPAEEALAKVQNPGADKGQGNATAKEAGANPAGSPAANGTATNETLNAGTTGAASSPSMAATTGAKPGSGQLVAANNKAQGQTGARLGNASSADNTNDLLVAAGAKNNATTAKNNESLVAANTGSAELSHANNGAAVADRSETIEVSAVSLPQDKENVQASIQPAVYRELDSENNEKALYLGAIELNRDKLRGFIRKAGSLFRGKNRTTEEDTKTPQ